MTSNFKLHPSNFSEASLVQQTTADYLQKELGWDSVYAYNNEDFGPDSLLGPQPLRRRLFLPPTGRNTFCSKTESR